MKKTKGESMRIVSTRVSKEEIENFKTIIDGIAGFSVSSATRLAMFAMTQMDDLGGWLIDQNRIMVMQAQDKLDAEK